MKVFKSKRFSNVTKIAQIDPNKLKPIRAYLRKDDNVTSVKRSTGENRDMGVSSPYVDARESTHINMEKIRKNRIVKNEEIRQEMNQSRTSSKEFIKQKPKQITNQYYPIRASQNNITSQLQNHRWKSTLHGRGLRSRFYGHNNQNGQNEENDENPGLMMNKRISNAIHDKRSASFQPSVIRRREGNKLQEVDLRKEMLENIKNRRQGIFNQLNILIVLI